MTAFPKYSKYKDSGVEWLGEVPEHWEVERLKGSLLEVDQRSTTGTETLLSLRMNVGLVPHNEVSTLPITSAQLIGYKKVAPGQVVMNRMRASSGIFAVATSHGLVSPDYAVFQPRAKQGTDYLLCLFKTGPMMTEFRRYSTGLGTGESGFLRLYSNFFFNIRCPIPPKAEEERIVAFLDEKTAQIDALIAKKQRQIELLDEQKAILINQAVTRGLNAGLSLNDSGIEWIGSIPSNWGVKKLRWLLSAAPKNGVSPPITETGQVPTLSIAAVKNGKVTFGENLKFTRISPKEQRAFQICQGDLLALRGNGSRHLVATCGQVGDDVPSGCIYPDLLIKLVPGSTLEAAYLIHLLNGPLRTVIHLVAKTSAGIWKVSGESLGALRIPLPPRDEQMAIVSHLSDVEASTTRTRANIESQIQSLQTLRSTLIAHAVTGKIKV